MARLFLSNINLGNPHSNTEKLIRVLKRKNWDAVFLVGNIIDFPALNAGGAFTDSQRTFLGSLLGLARRGCNTYWLGGNKDRAMRALVEQLASIPCLRFVEEHSEKGVLIKHGKQKATGLWSKIQLLRGKEKKDVLAEAKKLKCRYVICGVGEKTEFFRDGKVTYINCGDWETNGTWVEEDDSGTINIFTFKGEQMVVWGI